MKTLIRVVAVLVLLSTGPVSAGLFGLGQPDRPPYRLTEELPQGWRFASPGENLRTSERVAVFYLMASSDGAVERLNYRRQAENQFPEQNLVRIGFNLDSKVILVSRPDLYKCVPLQRGRVVRQPACDSIFEVSSADAVEFDLKRVADGIAQIGGPEGMVKIVKADLMDTLEDGIKYKQAQNTLKFLADRGWALSPGEVQQFKRRVDEAEYENTARRIQKDRDEIVSGGALPMSRLESFYRDVDDFSRRWGSNDPMGYCASFLRMKGETARAISAAQTQESARLNSAARALASWRAAVKPGSETNCGPVIDAKGAMAQIVIVPDSGAPQYTTWIRVADLYPAGGASCVLRNGQYQTEGDQLYLSRQR